MYKGRGIGQVVSARVVSCSLLCSALLSIVWHFWTIFPRPLPASPESSLSLTLESHLGPDNSIITALGWPRRAIPLSADQVAAWTWVTAARLVRSPQLLVVVGASKKEEAHHHPPDQGPDQTRIQATRTGQGRRHTTTEVTARLEPGPPRAASPACVLVLVGGCV